MAMKKRGSTIGKTMRDFDKIVGGNPQRTYQGQCPAPVDKRALRRMAVRTAKIAEKLDAESQIFLEAFSKHRTYKAAWLSLYPDCKPESAGRQGFRMMEKIRETLTEKEIKAMLGLSPEAIIAAVGRGLIAKAEKIFINTKTSQIVKSEPFDDTANQLVAARLGAQMEGMIGGDEDKKSGPVVINIVSYLNGPIAEQRPWPNGGRVAPDGVLRPTVGPNSYAALAARGALPASQTTVDLSDRKNERDD